MDINDNEIISRGWYRPFCTPQEIDRILSPQTPLDFLLKERADIVADHMRYLRVYRNKFNKFKNWSFEKSFVTKHYEDFYTYLCAEDKVKCNKVTFGDIFSNDVNGYAIKNESWGIFIQLNVSLQFFMKFCNLSLLDFSTEIPDHIRANALRIAMRIMLKNESMDFFMDPRGIVPEEIGLAIHEPIGYQLQYIAGHEFSHYLCDHLDGENITLKSVLSLDSKKYLKPVYNISQIQEFEADKYALIRPNYNLEQYDKILNAAFLWFISLELSEFVQDIISPKSSFYVNTHPSAEERFLHIKENVKIPSNFEWKKINRIIERKKYLKDFLLEDLTTNIETYEFYGSAYLDEPNSEWRGKELIDRVDYY